MEEIREIDENNENKTDVSVMLAFDYIGDTDARAWGCVCGGAECRGVGAWSDVPFQNMSGEKSNGHRMHFKMPQRWK